MAKSRPRRRPLPATPTALVPSKVDRPLFYGGPDPIALNRMETLVNNLRSLQEDRGRRRTGSLDPRRNISDECGYPDLVSPEDYKDLIDREPVAGLVNAIYPLESWQSYPTVYEDEDTETETEFETAWDELPKMLGPEPSHHSGEDGNAIYEFLLGADILAGYGRYGVILLGLDDLSPDDDMTKPAVPRPGMKLNYLRAFPEHMAKVSAFDMVKSSRRCGMPSQYLVTFSDPQDQSLTGINDSYTSTEVHWSRIVHIIDRWHAPSTSLIFGQERLRPVLNPVLDIQKVRGSSAEMYYMGAFFGLHFGTHPQLGPDVDVDADSLKDMYEEYKNGLQRALFTSGMTVDPLAPQVVDPTSQIKAQLEAIAIRMRCPMRILVGSERGELASGDDKKKWNGRLTSRQRSHNTPRVIVPFADRLINLGVLPTPKAGYRVKWPAMENESAQEKAQTLLVKTQAYGTYVSQGVEQIVPPKEYMTQFDDKTEEEADAILDEVAATAEESFTIEPSPEVVQVPAGGAAGAGPKPVGAAGAKGGASGAV